MRKLTLSFVALLLLLVGCSSSAGSDDGAAQGGKTIVTETTLPSLALGEIDAAKSPFCAAWLDLRTASGDDISSFDPAAKRDHYVKLLPTVEKLVQAAPADIASTVADAKALTQSASETGDDGVFQTAAARKTQERLLLYAASHCRKA